MQYFILSFILIFGILIPSARAQEEKTDEEVKVNGVIFNIAKDRQIEKIGGIYRPEELDKYVDRRFTSMSERLEKIEAQLNETNQRLGLISAQLAERPAVVTPVENVPPPQPVKTPKPSQTNSPRSPFQKKNP